MEKILEEFRCFILVTSMQSILLSKNILFQGLKTYFDFLCFKGFSVLPELLKSTDNPEPMHF